MMNNIGRIIAVPCRFCILPTIRKPRRKRAVAVKADPNTYKYD